MFAVVQLPDFPLQALLRFQPALRSEPVAILSGEGRRAVLAHVNSHAHGVTPGMTATQALAECAALQLLAPSFTAEREAGALLLSACWSLSPRVEAWAAGRCTIDLHGADRAALPKRITALREDLNRHDLTAQIGVGANPVIASYAANVARPERWVEDARSFLAPLPISFLALTADEKRLFGDLGLSTLGALTAFPRAALANRFGARGDALWAEAAGEWTGTLQPAKFPTRFFAEMELPDPAETLEPLLFVLRRFSERLAAEVSQLGQGTNRLLLSLRLDNDQVHERCFDLPEPTVSPDAMFAVLEHHVATLTTEAPVVALSLEVFPAHRLEQQSGLFDTGLTDAAAFFATLARVAAVVGTENVGTPCRADTHCPDAFIFITPPTAVPARVAPPSPPPHGPMLRRLRPPIPATVELTAARPSYLISQLTAGDVVVLRRPFWANGEWGAPSEWKREEWDVRVGNGLYRLLHDPDGWFLDGVYD